MFTEKQTCYLAGVHLLRLILEYQPLESYVTYKTE